MQSHIIHPSLKHSNTLVQCSNVHWVDFGECCIVFLGTKQLNLKEMYFIHLKVLRDYDEFSPFAKSSNGLSFWWLICGKMVYRFMQDFFGHMILCNARAFESTCTLKMQIFDLPSSNFNLQVRHIF